MDVFRTKLYQYYPGKEATEKEMLENVSKTFQDYPNSDDIVYVIESNQEGYVKEISTGLLLPVFKGDKLVYRDGYVDSEVEYFENYSWRSRKMNVRTRTSIPTHVLAFQDRNIEDCYAGVPSLELYSSKAFYHDIVQYIEKYSNIGERYQYLCNKLYNTNSVDLYNVEEVKKLRADISQHLRKRCHIFSGSVYSPFMKGKIYSVYSSFLEDNKKLPLNVSISSDEDVGFQLYRQLPLHDFDRDDTLMKKLFVTMGRDGYLREIRSKKIIPLVYYSFDEDSKIAKLMINGREATENEQISFFIFMPSSPDEFQLGDKRDIRFYKKYYTNFESVLDSYLSNNQVLSYKTVLKEVPKDSLNPEQKVSDSDHDKEEKKEVSLSLTFEGSTFSNHLPQILEVRSMILSSNFDSSEKEQYLSKLESIFKRYDSDIKTLEKSILKVQDESIIQNRVLKELTAIEASLSTSDVIDDYHWVVPYLDFLECDSNNFFDCFKNLYYFSLDFQSKSMNTAESLLLSMKVQQEIDERLFSSLLRLNAVEQSSAIFLLNDSTVERLATVVDNHIDKVSEADGDIMLVNALKNYNEEKAFTPEKDTSFLRDYLVNTISSYSQLDSVKVLGKEGV